MPDFRSKEVKQRVAKEKAKSSSSKATVDMDRQIEYKRNTNEIQAHAELLEKLDE